MPKAIIHIASGEFRDPQGRFLFEPRSQGWREAGCPAPTDHAYSLIDLPDGTEPDRVRHRYDPATGRTRLTVRRTSVTAWNAMTPAEKRTAVLAQVDIWRDLRALIEKTV